MVKWYILSDPSSSTILSIEFSTSLLSHGSNINDTIGKCTSKLFSIISMFCGELSADFNQK